MDDQGSNWGQASKISSLFSMQRFQGLLAVG
jgi:hypothetical protein